MVTVLTWEMGSEIILAFLDR